MIRILITTPLLIVILGLATLYYAYGEVDPCRTLAVERARRADHTMGVSLGHLTESITRLGTSQMTTGDCVKGLVRSWRERLEGTND
ncbi:MAG: hypothetical protein KGR48_17545 [Alphaproteobacteria bacterium]|nr:hypothetical protein [Alphaproteobacteria bacterium]MBU6472747.1 hypothetical protein [Alphaproteobacteria bacterium]MDE2013611.1 hypothetical protein [Alphaproteobacteria bacterium]MDE2074252.1 hypothetical protein [Alphaproteobacteria bacterium]MDE2351798.1 hypothetical protein [Alphaproteobacteria bacterium]